MRQPRPAFASFSIARPGFCARTLLRGLAILFLAGMCNRAAAQHLSPEESLSRMSVANGLTVTLAAAEPMVRQPVAMEFDDAGRLWVIQYLQYPNPAGLKRVKVDRYSRTQYDQIPAPPPDGPQGEDRISILLDTDGDGRADASKDFVTGLNLCTGMAFGHGGLFVLNVPYLLFYPDRNRDDIPDSNPQVLLEGFGMEDAHSVANSLAFGPDGWLYGCQGSTVTAHIRGVEFQQGVWRYHPLTKEFELFCEGGGNCWGLDFNAAGQLFYSTNLGGHVACHGVPGGYYWKSFGKHGALHNPFTFGYFEHVPHQGFRGGHVTAGGLFVHQAGLGDAFLGKFIGADLLGHAVYWHALSEQGASYTAAFEGVLLESQDPWFAPCDLTIGPDGALYVADWHDARTAHPDPDAAWDRSNGRIYRICQQGHTPQNVVDVRTLPAHELVPLLDDDNVWLARRASRELAYRQDAQCLQQLRAEALQCAASGSSSPAQDNKLLKQLWALIASGQADAELVSLALRYPFGPVRAWAARAAALLVGEPDSPKTQALKEQWLALAQTETNPLVLCEMAAAAQKTPAAFTALLTMRLAEREELAGDPYLPLLIYWAWERHALALAPLLNEALSQNAIWESSLFTSQLLPRLIRRYAADDSAPGFEAAQLLVEHALRREQAATAWKALGQGLQDRPRGSADTFGSLFTRFSAEAAQDLLLQQAESVQPATAAAKPAAADELKEQRLQALRAFVWKNHDHDPDRIQTAARLGEPLALSLAGELAQSPAAPEQTRVQMLQLLGEQGAAPQMQTALWQMARSTDTPLTVRQAALSALAHVNAEPLETLLLDWLLEDPQGPMAGALQSMLLRRGNSALQLLLAVDSGRLPAGQIPLDSVRHLSRFEHAEIDALVLRHWGSVQTGTPEERLAEMRRLSNDLRAAAGDAAAGKAVFIKRCGLCHKLFGEGAQVGPDLTSANRKDLEYLLVSLVDPSAVIRREFLAWQAETTDGRIVTGLLADQTPAQITLLTEKNERVVLTRDQIVQLQESSVSLMPDKMWLEWTPQQLRDLFAYLQAAEPAAAP